MAQARTLRKSELKQLIDVTASCSRYPQRDVTMLLFSHLCGLRVGEIASLRFDDVLDDKSNVLDEITLDASRTKGKRARKIFLPRQMQKHLQEYVASILALLRKPHPKLPIFASLVDASFVKNRYFALGKLLFLECQFFSLSYYDFQ